jgi:hypothetical protein
LLYFLFLSRVVFRVPITKTFFSKFLGGHGSEDMMAMMGFGGFGGSKKN